MTDSVPTEAFFSTMAQVLPTLLIAYVIEVGLIVRQQHRLYAPPSWMPTLLELPPPDHPDRQKFHDEYAAFNEWRMERATADSTKFYGRRATFALTFGLVVVVGEVAALLGLFTAASGAPRLWLGWVAFMTTILATLAVLWMPVSRLYMKPFESMRRTGSET